MPPSWFVTPRSKPQADLRLFAVPYAGRGASLFYPWHDDLPDWIDLVGVQLPGREGRMAEPAFTRIAALVDSLAEAMLPRIDGAYALFGHSMGALICYEVTRKLVALGAPLPHALVLSGHQSPTLPKTEEPMHGLSDAAFVQTMQDRYDGIPAVVLEQPDLLRLLLPTLRRDIEAIETYVYRPAPPLTMPFLLYGGTQDPQLAGNGLVAWRPLTTGETPMRLFQGGHFYLQEQRRMLTAALIADLRPYARLPLDLQYDRVR